MPNLINVIFASELMLFFSILCLAYSCCACRNIVITIFHDYEICYRNELSCIICAQTILVFIFHDCEICYRHELKFCDVDIVVGSESFHLHRALLSACSSYFYAMFTGKLLEMTQDRVEIQCVTPNIFRELINFIYTGIATELFCLLFVNMHYNY